MHPLTNFALGLRRGASLLALSLSLAAAGCGGISVAPLHDAGLEAETADAAAGAADAAAADVTADGASDATVPEASLAEGSAPDVQTTADVAEPPFTPQAIASQLAFWFDPSSMVVLDGHVPKWTDLSGNGNDAVQPTTAYEPAYTTSGIAGLPSATFSGPITFLTIADTASMEWGTSDFLLLAVVRATADTTSAAAMVYQKTGPSPFDGASLYLNANKPVATTRAAAQVSGGTGFYVVSSPPPATFDDSSVHVLGAHRSGVTLEIRVDGQVSSSMTSPAIGAVDVSAPGSFATIGQNGYGTPTAEFQQVHGDVAELLAVRGSLDPTTVAALEQYLKTRYAIP